MLIGFFSAGGSPGVTTTVLAMGSVWPSPVVVIDADPSGGDVAAAGGGLVDASLSNILELVRLSRHARLPQVLDSQIQATPFGTPVVVGFGDPTQVGAVSWPDLAAGLRAVQHRDVLVDLGRWGMPFHAAPLLRACDLLLLVVRTQTRALRRAERILPLVREDLNRANPGNAGVDLLVVEDNGSFSTADISRRMGVHVLGELPHDTKSAAVFSDGATAPRHLERTPLVRSVHSVVRTAGQVAQQRRNLGMRAPLLRQQPTTITPRGANTTDHTAPPSEQAAVAGLSVMPRTSRRLRPVPPREGDT
jgi:hypothetical protein